MKYIVSSKSGEHEINVVSNPCNGDPSFISYRFLVDGVTVQAGVIHSANVSKVVRKYANRVYVGVKSVKLIK